MYTIEDLKNGKCAVINDGTVEELREVLKLAFPNDNTIPVGDSYCYYSLGNMWFSELTHVSLPTQSVKDFLKPQLKRGDMVWVSNRSIEDAIKWKSERIFLVEIKGANNQFICVIDYNNKEFKEGKEFGIISWKYAVPVQEENEVTMTVKEIEEKLGIKNLHIVR